METVSLLTFRRRADAIIRQIQQGKRLVLTYRGKPVMRLEPIEEPEIQEDDPFYKIDQLAVSNGKSLTNEAMDRLIYDR